LLGITCVKNLKNCKKISDILGNCSSCYSGYKMIANACILCDFTNCLTGMSSVISNVCTCTQCNLGFYLPVASVVCTACTTPNCGVCSVLNVCTQCKSNFYLTGVTCTLSTASNCLIASTAVSTCGTCNNRYYLGSNNLCYSCQSSCSKCSSQFTCISCDPNFYLHPNNYCIIMPNNCVAVTVSTGICTLCLHGYFLVAGVCQTCSI
jgi:proprotein convertase subtilisin/kexin type 5